MHLRFLSICSIFILSLCLPSFPVLLEGNDSFSGEADRVLQSINDIRVRNGVHMIRDDIPSSIAAARHAEELGRRQTLSHRGLDGSRVAERYREAGGSGLNAGENLGSGDSILSIISAWMESPSHRRNILNPEWFSAGVGYLQINNDRIILVMIFNDSRWEQTSFMVENGNVSLEGKFTLAPGIFPERIFLDVNGKDIDSFTAAILDENTIGLQFIFPEPELWLRNDILPVTLSAVEAGLTRQTDLIFLTR